MTIEISLPAGVSVWTPDMLKTDMPEMHSILDDFGARSASAQGISQPMTTASKFISSDHRVYIMSDGQHATGFLKVGPKHLYHYNKKGKLCEIDPTCALDFFVDENCQRQGIGLSLIYHFLETEGCEARMVAWDKPTPKSLGLVSKHFGLTSFVPQPNNFVVFDEYFS
mmetsp:Transcript_23000/g.47051  ORF Transcript_23000/g.47051 Transcript_23000/m.47051 type:complete len:168 (+) Transcript_23000:76-579(+)|eukprot:CAMPEP_0171595760 /NCGR_PEP_ID=MMETSP0990-20121206/1526_1 /TAXON_ID=483369 /ORGANISM="non described non described, Strain CCMP2098" /LENGTH=167 /DNA_ID=CAMNT_0012156801 /DNA_START=61 /DNA_END=564 /DNA_ORIENTATION=+